MPCFVEGVGAETLDAHGMDTKWSLQQWNDLWGRSKQRYRQTKEEKSAGSASKVPMRRTLETFFFLSGCGVWTQENAFFNIHFTPEMNVESGQIEVKSPAMEGFIRFWTFIIILQVQYLLWKLLSMYGHLACWSEICVKLARVWLSRQLPIGRMRIFWELFGLKSSSEV